MVSSPHDKIILLVATTTILFNFGYLFMLVEYLKTFSYKSSKGCNGTEALQLKIEEEDSILDKDVKTSDKAYCFILTASLVVTYLMIFLTLVLQKFRAKTITPPTLAVCIFAVCSALFRSVSFIGVGPYFGISLDDMGNILIFAGLELAGDVLLLWLVNDLRLKKGPSRDPNRLMFEWHGIKYSYKKQTETSKASPILNENQKQQTLKK